MQQVALYNLYITRTAAVLTIFCALAVFLYGIFLLMAVSHTAKRTEAERQITQMSEHLGDIEMQYLTQQKTLTPERAAALGFVKPVVVSTVYAAVSSRTLTLNTLGE